MDTHFRTPGSRRVVNLDKSVTFTLKEEIGAANLENRGKEGFL